MADGGHHQQEEGPLHAANSLRACGAMTGAADGGVEQGCGARVWSKGTEDGEGVGRIYKGRHPAGTAAPAA